jgi:hypothetical protein
VNFIQSLVAYLTPGPWWKDHVHVWLPVLILLGLAANKIVLGNAWPDLKQFLRIAISGFGFSQAGKIWYETVEQKTSQGTWMQVVGAMSVAWLAAITLIGVMKELRPKIAKARTRAKAKPKEAESEIA